MTVTASDCRKHKQRVSCGGSNYDVRRLDDHSDYIDMFVCVCVCVIVCVLFDSTDRGAETRCQSSRKAVRVNTQSKTLSKVSYLV